MTRNREPLSFPSAPFPRSRRSWVLTAWTVAYPLRPFQACSYRRLLPARITHYASLITHHSSHITHRTRTRKPPSTIGRHRGRSIIPNQASKSSRLDGEPSHPIRLYAAFYRHDCICSPHTPPSSFPNCLSFVVLATGSSTFPCIFLARRPGTRTPPHRAALPPVSLANPAPSGMDPSISCSLPFSSELGRTGNPPW